MASLLESIAAQHGLVCGDQLRADFLKWAEEQYAQEFIERLMNKAKIVETAMNDFPNPFKNGRKGSGYTVQFSLPESVRDARFTGLEDIGLAIARSEEDATLYTVSGIPQVDGDQEVVLEYVYDGWMPGMPSLKRGFRFAINPDPRDLWKNLPVPDDVEYPKSDTDSDYIRVESRPNGKSRKDMVAASRRGRSHAHEGKPRDDHFLIRHCPKSDWYILAVADGAGSAEFSREGSRIACNVAVDYCEKQLQMEDNSFDTQLIDFINAFIKKSISMDIFLQKCNDLAYNIISRSAYAAYKSIFDEAKAKRRQIKFYSTTLLLVLCKFFKGMWIIISFNIGDGAIGYIKYDGHLKCNISELLCKPDEGEFSGQTRFLTMSEIFKDHDALKERIRTTLVNHLVSVLLMTDGVSDAKFETDANLNNPQKWLDLWEDINAHVHLRDDSENSKNELLDWLNFWSQGNHDDRTIAILY